ncbi:unnamed protein product [Paramecium pentaurelia]|uniref:Transmembrane protein n=1 Tax=Paramecium pentaurelia TaxID=43138 RepID=A0A8S1T3E1_9CILI|nr:unnamed protein product [Paramecium pentaurelia]
MDPTARQSENQEKLIVINRSQNIRLIKHTFQLFIIIEILVIISKYFFSYSLNFYVVILQALYSLQIRSQQIVDLFLLQLLRRQLLSQQVQIYQLSNLCSNVSTSEQYPMDHCLKSQDFNIFRYILSSILILIVLIMIFDIYRMMNIKNELKNQILSPKLIYKAKKYQIFIILLLCLYYVILFIFIFGIDGYYCSGLGSAFFVGFSGFLIYLIIIIYFRYLKGRLSRESYFENLLNGGLEASDLQQNFEFKTVECREERFYSVPDIDN